MAFGKRDNPFRKYLTEEDKLHEAVLKYIAHAYHGAKVLHAPLEGKRTPFEKFKAALLGINESKGFSDLLIFYKGKVFGLELKTLSGTLSPEQIEWGGVLISCGIPWFATYGIDEAIKCVDDNLKPLKVIRA